MRPSSRRAVYPSPESTTNNEREFFMATTSSEWSSRLGFILASAGSAIGLGAIWKFPFWAGVNGGGAFIIPYIIFTFTIGVALVIAEVAIGRLPCTKG